MSTTRAARHSQGSVPANPAGGLSTQAVHAGEARHKPAYAITDAIFCASTYTFPDTQSVIDYIEQQQPRDEYSRYGHPNQRTVEQKLAALEGTERAVLFASGMAAFSGLMLARLNAGDEIVIFDECYHRSREFCLKHLSRFGILTHPVRTGDFEAMQAALSSRTRFLISEVPTNPHLTVIDIERFAELGREHGVETVIDATLATPYNFRPAEWGIDYIIHSATKYLGGHNDLLAGCVAGAEDKLAPVAYLRGLTGGVASPHCCYLLERGLKTLELRMERHNQNGLAVARFLDAHPRVERVYYPGLPSHPDHACATRFLRGWGGLVTFLIRDADWRETARIVDATRIPRIAPSLGGVESLIEQPYVMSYYQATPAERAAWRIPDQMIRLSCGIENTEDLIADLEQALAQ